MVGDCTPEVTITITCIISLRIIYVTISWTMVRFLFSVAGHCVNDMVANTADHRLCDIDERLLGASLSVSPRLYRCNGHTVDRPAKQSTQRHQNGWVLRWAKSRESYRRITSESYRSDSNH